MADNVSVLIDFSVGTDGSLILAPALTTGTINASGITTTWSLSRTPLQHTYTRLTTVLPLLEPITCNGITYSSTPSQAIEYDLDLAVSQGIEQQTLSFGANSVGNVSLGSMSTFDADTGAQIDIFYIYSPFSVVQYRSNSGIHSLHAHSTFGGPSTGGALIDISPNTPYWISERCNVTDGTVEVVVQNGTTGAFIGCSRCQVDPFALVSIVLGDYLVVTGGSFKHSLVALAFDALATLPLAPGSFVLPPPPFVVATDNDTDITLDFGHLTASGLAFGYMIERTDDGGSSWDIVEANLEVPFTGYVSPYTDSTVADDVTYQYRISALIHGYSSVPTYSNYITHGAAVWYDTIDPLISDTTDNLSDSSYARSVSVTLPEGTASKLRVWIQSSTDVIPFKVALYDNSGNLLADAVSTAPPDITFWQEILIPPTDITAGTYKVAWSALGGSTDISFRYKNGLGHTDVTTLPYASFPGDPLGAPDFTNPGTDAAGVYVAPVVTLNMAVVLHGAPIL